MLQWRIVEYQFTRFVQSGMYIDFIFKKVIELVMRNLLVYGAQFFGEKYVIEHFTKKVVEYAIFNINNFTSISVLNYVYYFIQIILFLVYIILILNIILFIL